MKKKSFGIILDFKNLKHFMHSQELLMKTISEQFESFYLINISHIETKFFSSIFFNWDMYSEVKYDPAIIGKLEYNNFTIFEPKDFAEFNNFFSDKEMVLINHIDRHYNHFWIWKSLKKHSIKQIVISNVSNQESSPVISNMKSKLIMFFGKRLPNKIFTLLGMLNIIPIIDIRFESNLNLIESMENKKKLFFNKRFFKKLVRINNRAYDLLKKKKLEISEDYIVLIDANLNHKEDVAIRGKLSESVIEKHYKLLNDHLSHLSKIFNKEIVICIHPQYDLSYTQEKFKNFKVFKFKTREFIYKSFLVIFYESTAIIDAYLLNKNIINLKPDFPWFSMGNYYAENFYTTQLDLEIEDERRITKERLKEMFVNSKKGYDKFNNMYVKSSDEEIGVEKAIRIIKKNYFLNQSSESRIN